MSLNLMYYCLRLFRNIFCLCKPLDLNEINHLLAATANDAYNALVCTRFAPEFGRNQVFQLPYEQKGEEDGEMARTVRGRIALDGTCEYDELMRRYYSGWRFHTTTLSKDYGYKAFSHDQGEQAIMVALIRDGKTLYLKLPEEEDEFEAGDVIISYQPPE